MSKKNKRELTKAQKAVYDAIVTYIDEHGYAPSVRDICEMTNLSSPATVKRHLDNLKKKGWINLSSYKARTITLVKEDADD